MPRGWKQLEHGRYFTFIFRLYYGGKWFMANLCRIGTQPTVLFISIRKLGHCEWHLDRERDELEHSLNAMHFFLLMEEEKCWEWHTITLCSFLHWDWNTAWFHTGLYSQQIGVHDVMKKEIQAQCEQKWIWTWPCLSCFHSKNQRIGTQPLFNRFLLSDEGKRMRRARKVDWNTALIETFLVPIP